MSASSAVPSPPTLYPRRGTPLPSRSQGHDASYSEVNRVNRSIAVIRTGQRTQAFELLLKFIVWGGAYNRSLGCSRRKLISEILQSCPLTIFSFMLLKFLNYPNTRHRLVQNLVTHQILAYNPKLIVLFE